MQGQICSWRGDLTPPLGGVTPTPCIFLHLRMSVSFHYFTGESLNFIRSEPTARVFLSLSLSGYRVGKENRNGTEERAHGWPAPNPSESLGNGSLRPLTFSH